MHGRRSRFAAVLLGVAIPLLTAPAAALAHAELIRSSPAADASLETAPQKLVLSFSQPVVPDRTEITLVDDTGKTIASVGQGLTPTASADAATVSTALPPLGKGLYKVIWRSLSKDDYHSVGDQFVFGVGLPVPGAARVIPLPPEPRPRAVETLLRWVSFLGGALLAGAALLAAVLRRRDDPDNAVRAWRPARIGAAVAIVAAVAQLLYQTSQAGASLGTTLTDTTFGQGWLIRTLLLAAGLGIAVVVRAPGPATDAAAAVALLAAAAGAIGSHASAFGTVASVILALHLVAAAAWSGVVVLVAVVFAPRLRDEATRAQALRALRAVAVVAVPAVAILAATGLYALGRHVASIDGLLTSIYGGTLLVKTALVVAAAALGMLTHRLVREDGGVARVLRTVPLEAGLLCAALLAAAVLAAGAPARGVRFDVQPPPPAPSVIDSRDVDDLLISVEVRPNQPGANFVTVKTLNTRRPAPAAIDGVTVTMDGTAVAAHSINTVNQSDCTPPGESPYACHWEAPVTLARAGQLPLTIAVSRSGLPTTTLKTTWTMAGGPTLEVPSTVVSRSRLAPATTWLAVLAALAAGVAILLGMRRTERPT